MTKREMILQTAMNLFIKKGIQSTSTASIAKKAGVATGTLFHHFKTKEELVYELYNLIFDSLIKYHKKHFKENNSAYERLKQLWFLNIEWGMKHIEYANFLERYAFHFYASDSAMQDASKRFDYYINTITDLISNKLTKCDDFEYVMNHFSWNMRMNGNYFISHPELYTREMLEKTFEIYWSGISNVSSDSEKKQKETL
nr:TetR/AcrR family transcriptional regulator [uncultured Sulfurimonas sp.]